MEPKRNPGVAHQIIDKAIGGPERVIPDISLALHPGLQTAHGIDKLMFARPPKASKRGEVVA